MDNFLLWTSKALEKSGLPDWTIAIIDPVLNILGAIGILIIGWWLAGWVAKKTKKACDKTDRIDNTITPLIVQFVRYAIIVTAVVSVLQIFGIGTASIIAVLGSFGLAIGLALQGAMSNVASGIMIVALRPFSVGNTVEIGGILGTVVQIGLFYTRLDTFDGVCIVMPNSKIWGTEIRNYSKNKIRRMNLKFGIGYGDDINKAYSIIDNIYKAEPKILDDPAPTIAVTELADSSVNLIAYAWTKTGDWWATQLKLVKTVKEAFDKEGISIPFPQTDVHLFAEKPYK